MTPPTSPDKILLILAAVCFAIATIKSTYPGNLLPLGLLLLTLTFFF